MDALLKAMSAEELAEFQTKYADNLEITKLVNAHLELVEAERLEAEKWEGWYQLYRDSFGEIPQWSPDWRKDSQAVTIYLEEIEDKSKSPEVVTNLEGEDELRFPKVLQLNHRTGSMVTLLKATSGPSDNDNGATKRQVHIFKHNPQGADTDHGIWANYAEFARSEGFKTEKNSAHRVVIDRGFYGVPTS